MDDSNGTSSTTPPTTCSSIAPTLSSTQQIFTSDVPLPPRLELRGNLAKNWKNWLQTWKAYETITSLHLKPQDYRVATFITCIGPEALEIHSGLPFASEAEKGRIDKVLELWNNYCVGKTNTIFTNGTSFTTDHKSLARQSTPMQPQSARWQTRVLSVI